MVLIFGTIVPSVRHLAAHTGFRQAPEATMTWEGWVPVDSIDLS